MSLLKIAKKRRATKAYSVDLIELKKLNYIFEVTNTSPTSMGLEAWRVISIRDKHFKEKSKEFFLSSNQKKYVDCSDAFMFITKKSSWFLKRSPELVKKVRRNLNAIAKEYRFLEKNEEEVNNYINYITTADHGNNNNDYTEWSKRQAYIASAFTMLAAMELGINSTPVEGFDKKLNNYLQSKKLIESDEVVALVIFLGYIKNVKHAVIGDKQLRQSISEKFQIK